VEHLLSIGAARWPKKGEQVALVLREDEGCVPGFRVNLCRHPERMSHARARADLDAARTQVLEEAPRVEEVERNGSPTGALRPEMRRRIPPGP
jgi:hypothetical protein